MGLIGSSDSGHHRSAKDAVVWARADDCATITPVMPRRTAATRRHWVGVDTRNSARLAPPPTDQNPPCKNNDMDPPHRLLISERRTRARKWQSTGPARDFSWVCYFRNKIVDERHYGAPAGPSAGWMCFSLIARAFSLKCP